MKVHEYQGKEILEKYGVAMQPGEVASTVDEAVSVAKDMISVHGDLFVVKAQIHAGGRGKGGGVKLAQGLDAVEEVAGKILGMNLVTHQTGPEGQLVRKILIAPAVNIAKEYYIGVTLDRARSQHVIMASTEGGVEIEKVAAETPEKILKVWADQSYGLQAFQARELAYGLGFEGKTARQAANFIMALFKAYMGVDASLAEINPLVLTEEGEVVAIDAKLNLDDNALYRHKDLAELRDLHEEDPLEVEAHASNLNYVKLDGNVGCMVNGAGLAMATMDIIKLAGGNPANFLDVGGTASAETVEAGFRIILKDPNVKAVLVNIFGGIVRCDRVARGVVEAAKNVGIEVPLIVRLQGTNASQGQAVLQESGIALESAVLFEQAAEKVGKALAA
ncbi:MAG: ADP-forming succinate--CoA ligase subunit beta [Rhodothermaceae bacterium]|nr:ADP-forming succinate--CoA ligase subunit beta [Rhodothermaceae bacterium]MXZ56876.1 ADP-forming succinate--CoA ligase subunit beta [Rhodothermaceae bacterium]MYB91423.1 ADP-forming succinate--CoA ligase subunit beta [Rhodothermaceae bacterium]MYD67875.1 ADP-forming succinate--CoA ligase subunit beta [Rhodothermaceae bacterium]MYG43534.1 ADP-forming succinate--CoA ligase subunit beta [Rhodothermaceae bacterium]